jgi:hypothetical protein
MFIVRVLAWQLQGKYMSLDKAFYNILFKQEVVAPPPPPQLLSHFFPFHNPWGGLHKKYNFTLHNYIYINYIRNIH